MSRTWVKLWVNEWLDGTTRFEMSGAQRAFWIDLLAMAGRSRFPGIVCAGQNGDRFVGYPLTTFAALDAGQEINILATFELFERTGKIVVELTSESPTKLYKVSILNWNKYQSEYVRQRGYRRSYDPSQKKVTPKVTTNVTTELTKKLPVETETEEELKHSCANPAGSHDSAGPSNPLSALKETVQRVWNYYLERLSKNPKLLTLTDQRMKKGLARLRECLAKSGGDLAKAEELMKIAVDALAASNWHRGDNDRKKAYDSWEKHLFVSQEKLEWWLEQ
jgi:hypothetical protein